MMDVICNNLFKSLLHEVGSCRRGIDSVMPPVRSENPSNEVPYFKASYDPCNLDDKVIENIHLFSNVE